jgi:hypothetical protein
MEIILDINGPREKKPDEEARILMLTYDTPIQCTPRYINNLQGRADCMNEDGESITFVNKEAALAAGYTYSTYRNSFVPEYGNDLLKFGIQKNHGYHTGLELKDKSDPIRDKIRIGFEVEKEDEDIMTDYECHKVYDITGWKKENDGSLSDGGFELVSPLFPLNMDIIKHELNASFLPILLNANSSERCGGHISVSHKDYDARPLLEAMKGFLPVLYALYPGRINNRYCTALSFDRYLNEEDKYRAVLIKARQNILEFRIFPQVKKLESLLFRAELMEIAMKSLGKTSSWWLKQFQNKDSDLYHHLKKMYSNEQIARKAVRYAEYGNKFISSHFRLKEVIETTESKLGCTLARHREDSLVQSPDDKVETLA